jgi:hypothetical protein
VNEQKILNQNINLLLNLLHIGIVQFSIYLIIKNNMLISSSNKITFFFQQGDY